VSKSTPTSRTLALLRGENYHAAVVERHIPHCFTTVDLFGVFDLVAVRADVPGVTGIQCTSGSNHASRVRKLLASEVLAVWLRAGNTALVISWTMRQRQWLARRQEITSADLLAGNPQPRAVPRPVNERGGPGVDVRSAEAHEGPGARADASVLGVKPSCRARYDWVGGGGAPMGNDDVLGETGGSVVREGQPGALWVEVIRWPATETS
jgi:hypothetical protein